MGEVTLTVQPCKTLKAFHIESFGNIRTMQGFSICTFLEDRKVAERQTKAANECLKTKGLAANIQIVNDKSNTLQKGSSITLWAETDTGTIIGADAIGELKKPSEVVGREAAEKLWTEIVAKPTVDVHLADMLIPYIALAKGNSVFLAREVTEHLETNIWLAEKMLNARFKVEKLGRSYRIEKLVENQ